MAGFSGRSLTIDWDSIVLAGVQSKELNITNEYADVTTDDDNGYSTKIAEPAVRSAEVTVSGVAVNETILASIASASDTGEALDVNLPTDLASPGTVSGTFLVTNYSTDGETDGHVKFSATFTSSGQFAYTASSA